MELDKRTIEMDKKLDRLLRGGNGGGSTTVQEAVLNKIKTFRSEIDSNLTDLRRIANNPQSRPADRITARKLVSKLEAEKGKLEEAAAAARATTDADKLKDIETKILPFPQMGVGLANKAVDAALVIPPWAFQLVDQGIGAPLADIDDYVRPSPINIAVMFINTDWAKQNPEVARNFFVAYARGIREYCQAYHNGPNRQEVIDIAVRTGVERRQELLYKYPWPARDPNGRVNVASLLDIRAWYVKAGLSQTQFPAERIVTSTYVDHAVEKLGPFVLDNKDSALPGCR